MTKAAQFSLALLAAAAAVALVDAQRPGPPSAPAPAPNTLTAAERAAGWTLLFDGATTTGWRGFHRDKMPDEGWVVEAGALKHIAGATPNGGDIITLREYANFDFRADWKISPGGNSGIKYLISEDLIKTGTAGLGFEMQVLDDDLNADARAGKDGDRRAGALYDLIPAPTKTLHAVGDWNQARLVVRGSHVEHWLNGAKILEFDIGSPDMHARIAASKYNVNPGFGDVRKGHILLQDHESEVWFRNIKILELPAP